MKSEWGRRHFWAIAFAVLGAGWPAPARGMQQEAETVIDLLKWIDPERDAVVGEWRRQESALLTPPVKHALLQVPYLPPREYDLSVVAELVGDAESLNLGL